jgi:putative serine protease XkdF
MKLKVYDMTINEHDETGVDINSFVDCPAHLRSFEVYDSRGNKILFAVDDQKRIVTGVFILADFLIYRNDNQLGEHYVKFSPEVIWQIRNKFFKNGFNNNTNVQHATTVKGATLVDSYIVHSTDPRFPKVPEILSKQKVTDGSWVGSYYVENENLWQDCKNGIFKGFSVEGYFDKVLTQITKTNMNKKTKSGKGLMQWAKNLFGEEINQETMAEATTVDGVVLFYDGDLAVGTALMVEVDGQKVPAPEGDHQVEVDGKTFAITLDAEGKITAMNEVTSMDEEEMSPEATILSSAIQKVVADCQTKFAKYDKKIAQLEADLKVAQAGDKFSAPGKKGGEEEKEKGGFKKLLKK